MDDEDDARYPPKPYRMNRQKVPGESSNYPQNSDNLYVEEDDNDDEEEDINNGDDNDDEDDEDDDDGGNGVQRIGKDDYEDAEEDDEYDKMQKHPKKRKLKNLMSNYEFAPRLPAPSSSTGAAAPKPSYGGRNPLTDWTEHETFVLLDAWGERYLNQGRKSLRSEEWQEVADRVSHGSKIERTDTQCRNRLDTLKKKYKKEKLKLGEAAGSTSEWVYFKKMDSLLSSNPQQTGLSCGLDSGEYVFTNPKVYLNRSNGLDEMRDSPANSEPGGADEDESEGLPPKRKNYKGIRGSAASFTLLADSIKKFSEIYEKMENNRRQQMVELEKMRMDFHRDLELQKRQILERAQAKIEKIRQGDYEDNDVSAENVSG